MKYTGTVLKYGDNVDTDVIIPARYLNTSDKRELASHCMEDIDKSFRDRVKAGDVMVGIGNYEGGSATVYNLLGATKIGDHVQVRFI